MWKQIRNIIVNLTLYFKAISGALDYVLQSTTQKKVSRLSHLLSDVLHRFAEGRTSVFFIHSHSIMFVFVGHCEPFLYPTLTHHCETVKGKPLDQSEGSEWDFWSFFL